MTGKISQATRERIYNLSLKGWTPDEIVVETKVSKTSVMRFVAVSAKLKLRKRRI